MRRLSTAVFVWDDQLATYHFTRDHPLNPRRLQLTVELLARLGILGDEDGPIVAPRSVGTAELEAVHDVAYIEAVHSASLDPVPRARYAAFGLGSEDVPVVRGMDEAARLVCGATLTAAEWVMTGRATRGFSISGGLHHARHAEAAGFCVYNDLAITIRWLQRNYNARVMYIDVDAHHGDGVQWLCYHDPSVLTVSLHESGAFLFPGTGFIDELGEGDGYGYSVNVPLDAHTEDASFLEAFSSLVPELAAQFRPDVILLQAGCDAHVLDPLTHLRCTPACTGRSPYHLQACRPLLRRSADRHGRGWLRSTPWYRGPGRWCGRRSGAGCPTSFRPTGAERAPRAAAICQ
jgi:acetoin utilization protein AcuC